MDHVKKFLLDLVANFKPIQISPTLKVENFNQKISIAGKEYTVEKGQLIVNDKDDDKIPLVKDSNGFVRPRINDVVVEGLSDNKKDNVKMLDFQGKVFTRADIGVEQLDFLTIEKEHEAIIKKLKPLIKEHSNSADLGALLIASTMIKVEDRGEDADFSLKLRNHYRLCYKKRGSMIYNLFRSGILKSEVLNHLNKLKKIYRNKQDFKMHFLIYWDSILEQGYPTAYFIREEDDCSSVHSEIRKRLNSGAQRIYVYSRTIERNNNSEKWCRYIAKEEGCLCKKNRKYMLGFTPAVIFRITKRSS